MQCSKNWRDENTTLGPVQHPETVVQSENIASFWGLQITWLFLVIPDCEWQPNALFFGILEMVPEGSGPAFSPPPLHHHTTTHIVTGAGIPLLIVGVDDQNYLQ